MVKRFPPTVDTKISLLYNYQGICVCMAAEEVHFPFKPSNMGDSQARFNARRGAWVVIRIYYVVTNIPSQVSHCDLVSHTGYPCILHYQLNLELNYLKNLWKWYRPWESILTTSKEYVFWNMEYRFKWCVTYYHRITISSLIEFTMKGQWLIESMENIIKENIVVWLNYSQNFTHLLIVRL